MIGSVSPVSSDADSISPLFRLALVKDEEASILLHLRRKAPVNGKDASGRTPLMIAALNGRLNICELLLHEGADVSICDSDGCNAFDLATRYGHHVIASQLQATLAEPLSEGNEPVVTVYPGEAISEGWEAEVPFQAPAENRGVDETVVALQVSIASHRVFRVSDDWQTADICLPTSNTNLTTVAIPRAVHAMIASGLAAAWLTDDAVTAEWPLAKREHILELRQLLAAANIRIFPARPGNPFQCIRNAEPTNDNLQLCQELIDVLRDTCTGRLDTVEKYKMEIASFGPFSPDREARIFGKVAEARARLIAMFAGFMQITPLVLQGELRPTEEIVKDATEEADDESNVFESADGVATETNTDEPAAPEFFLRDFIKLFGELEQKTSDRQNLIGLRLALENYRKARDRGMEGGLKLVPWLAYRYRRRGLPIEDLIQEGNIGLMRAVEKFDSTKGSRFGSYAVWWIRQAMLRAIEDQSRLIRVPVHIGEFVRKTERIRQRTRAGLGREASIEEIAGELEVSPGKIKNVLAIPGSPFPAVSRLLVDDRVPLPDHRHDLSNLRSLTSEMLLMLPARTERVLRLRFGLGGVEEHTLEEVGEKFDVTRERIRQIEAKGLRILRHPNRSRKLEAFL
ncbi:sigma-70 family RNA polymerase sigma factor [Ochrobactrum sp. GPK 3]